MTDGMKQGFAQTLLGLLAVGILASMAVQAAAHLHDREHLSHVSGAWIGLSDAARHGDFYPALYDPESGVYGGTRFGPLPIAIQAWAAEIFNDEITGGKVVSLAEAGLLVLAMFVLLLRLRCSAGLAAALSVLPLVTSPGQLSALSIRHDALATAMQVLAVLCASMVRGRAQHGGPARDLLWAAGAGLMCGLAFFAKASGVWATLAIALWFLLHHRRALLTYIPVGLVVGAVGVGVVQWFSEGEFFRNMRYLLLAGEGAGSAFGPSRLWDAGNAVAYWLFNAASAAFTITPLALIAVGLAVGIGGKTVGSRRGSLVLMGLVLSVLLCIYMFTNPGVAINHLLDPVVLLALVVGELDARFRYGNLIARDGRVVEPGTPTDTRDEKRRSIAWGPNPMMRGVILVTVGFAVLAAAQHRGMVGDTRAAVELLRNPEKRAADLRGASWRERFEPGDRVLSSDATLPVLMGQRPVILDSFMLRRIVERDPEAEVALIRRIEAKEFDYVLSVTGLRGQWGGKPLRRSHWGPGVIDAIDMNYEADGEFWGYSVYRRRGG